MKTIFILSILVAFSGCKNDVQRTLENCTAVSRQKEVNTTSTPQTYGPTDRVAIRMGYMNPVTVQKIMLKAWNIGNPAMAIDFYQTESNIDPDDGLHLGSAQAIAESSPTSPTEVWFKLVPPIKIDTFSNNTLVILSFGGGMTVDYGETSGASLRSEYTTGSTISSWNVGDRNHGISFGYEGSPDCW